MTAMLALPAANALHLNWDEMISSLDWDSVRRPRRLEDWMLLADTSKWLKSLPLGARPLQLPKRYPRIANELCRLWNDATARDAYLLDLLQDRRGDRQGFPALIQEELQALCGWVRRHQRTAMPA